MQNLLTTVSIHHHFHFLDLLLLLYVITTREILCMIHFSLNVLYEVNNPLAQHFKTKFASSNYFLLFMLIIFEKRFKKISNNIICVTNPHNFYVITPYTDSASFSSIFRRNKIYVHRYLNFPNSSSNPMIIYRIIKMLCDLVRILIY